MLERDMEDLIAAHPKDFFRREFILIGRQQSFAEVGRFDLLFKDEYGCTILVELKARVAKYEDASQLAKYKDELERRGTALIQMWLVAPHIPPSVRQFLDHIGIQYTEIHEAEFRTVANGMARTFRGSSTSRTPPGNRCRGISLPESGDCQLDPLRSPKVSGVVTIRHSLPLARL